MTAESGANVFRVAMYTGEGGYISQPENVKNLLVSAVDNAIAEDMYVIIDWHILSDGNPMTYVEESKKFFDEMSAKYADTPNVLYEICNEPNGNVSWANDIKPYAEQVIPVIRENSPQSIILVGSGTWSQDINEPADNPLSFDNIMYTCHFYAGTHGSWLRDRIDYALSKGAPIFISEWGTSAADGNGGVFENETREWLDFLNERNISWCNWSLCDKAESSAALSGDGLSESGKLVFSEF
jgi:endoglucanase